ncbi:MULTISPECIES: hypothetical protein [Mycobacteriales]|nr:MULTISPECIES: hypothetical protein [Gordonia]ADK68881.1 hypothetical protein KTR9_4800 [Gordonia sp. KTR9]ART90633.1 hypothetical protein [Rhodococcus rhodochrous]MCZ4581573.1 hypothetical protein [Gordonia amicalis]OOL33120.1 Hypothetical protein GQ85_016 [Rhodococcus rhodochrous]
MSSDPKAGLFEYTAGLDIGNGYVKGVIEDRSADPHDRSANVPVDMVDMPSVAATLIRPNLLQTPDADAPDVLADGQEWFDNADLVFSSNLVPDTYRRVIGRRALATKASSVDAFDLVGNKSKAEQPLSKVLVLGILAAKALRDYVAVTGQLPSPNNPDTVASLTVRAVLALALPISEYEVHRNSYSASFVGTATEPLVHQVRINNFVTPVTVSIVFDNVLVVPEGASAQYAINYFGEPLMERLLADVRSRGVALEGIEATHLLAATDTIGVDVGEGTVNFPVFTGGRFNADASRTLPAGYGTVLENTIEAMTEKGEQHGFAGRKHLANFLQAEVNPLKAKFRARVVEETEVASDFFVREVALELSRVLDLVGAVTQAIYVYGGGSGPLRESLHKALLDKVTEMNGEDAAPVLYLDSAYSRGLNREGLIIAARNRAAALAPAAAETGSEAKSSRRKVATAK